MHMKMYLGSMHTNGAITLFNSSPWTATRISRPCAWCEDLSSSTTSHQPRHWTCLEASSRESLTSRKYASSRHGSSVTSSSGWLSIWRRVVAARNYSYHGAPVLGFARYVFETRSNCPVFCRCLIVSRVYLLFYNRWHHGHISQQPSCNLVVVW